MKKSLFFLLAAAAAIVSCAKEGFETLPQQGRVRFEVTGTESFPGTPGISPAEATRAYLSDGYTICWEKGKDVVCIFNKNEKYHKSLYLNCFSVGSYEKQFFFFIICKKPLKIF